MPEYKSNSDIERCRVCFACGSFRAIDIQRARRRGVSQQAKFAGAARRTLVLPDGSCQWPSMLASGAGRSSCPEDSASSEKRSAPAAATQSETSARTQRPVTTGHASAEVVPETNVAQRRRPPPIGSTPRKLLNQSSTVPPAAQQPSSEERSAGSSDPPSPADESPAPTRSVVASAGDGLPQTVTRTEEPRRIVPHRAKSATSIVDDDHTFALLLLMFVTFAIAGPMLHFSERRRRRLARPVQPPRWAPTDTPNEPVADIEMPLAPAPAIDQCPEPPASTSPFETERLEKALQQLLDRLQTEHPSMQSAAPSARRMEIEMKKSA